MGSKFSTDVRFNHNMGLLETLSFQGEGVGAALYIAGFMTGRISLEVLGIAFVLGAVVVLRAHLGQPTRGWRALRRLHSAWVSRGTLAIGGFVGLSVLAQVATFVPRLRPLENVLGLAALVVAVPVVIYAGMLLRSMRAIRFWHSLNVPLAFSAHSAATALIIACVPEPELRVGAMATLLVAGAISALHLLLIKRSLGTQASIDRLLRGDLRGRVIGLAGVLGIAIPLVTLAASWAWDAAAAPNLARAMLVAAALLRIYGDFEYRYAIVLAGAYEPVFPTGAPTPFVRSRAAA